jgi:hypothetical protein
MHGLQNIKFGNDTEGVYCAVRPEIRLGVARERLISSLSVAEKNVVSLANF